MTKIQQLAKKRKGEKGPRSLVSVSGADVLELTEKETARIHTRNLCESIEKSHRIWYPTAKQNKREGEKDERIWHWAFSDMCCISVLHLFLMYIYIYIYIYIFSR